MTMKNCVLARGTVILALLTLLVALPQALAFAGDPGDVDKERHVIEKVIEIYAFAGCDDGDEDCEEGIVWVMENDSSNPDGPQVRVLRGPGPHMLRGKRGFLGVGFMPLNQELLDHYRVSSDGGVLVATVEKDSPAERAGVRVGDVLTSIDGDEVGSGNVLRRAIAAKKDGDAVDLEIWRDGRPSNLTATIEERERPQFDLGGMMFPGGEENRFLFQLDPDTLADAQEQLGHVLEMPEFSARLHSLGADREGLTKRLQQVEKQLEELQQRLQEMLAAEKDR